MAKIKINNITIGDKYPPTIIVELGINHSGNLDKAIHLVDIAKKNGANIIKHQTHIPNEEMSSSAKRIIPGNAKESIFEVIKKNCLSLDKEKKLAEYIRKKNMTFISTPFSFAAVDRLKELKVPAIKIGSGECNNYPLIKKIANLKLPVILSTGMNNYESIARAVKILRNKKIKFALLQCTNVYPTPFEFININCVSTLKKKFPDAVVGISDHSTSIYPYLSTIPLGTRIIEKHFTLDKKSKGPDMSASLDPKELKEIIKGSNEIFLSLGDIKGPYKIEKPTIKFAFASAVAKKEIFPGDKINEKNCTFKRPGDGDFLARDFKKLFGKTASKKIQIDQQIKKKHL